ncbi:MAG: hypothetical protein R3D05_14240 [Dongiaceae bacterium]
MGSFAVAPLRALALAVAVFLFSMASSGAHAQQTGLLADGRIVVSAAANADIQHYVEAVSGRFGALAVSQDGTRAVSYICQSRLWKNCDEPGGDESNLSIPSGRLARDEALTRCRSQSGAACILLFINDDQQREFAVQP